MAKYQGYSLTVWPKLAHFHHFSICNQKQSIAISVIVAHFWQTTKAIALRFGQNWLIVTTCQSAIKINQFQFRSFVAHFWAKYQGYSLTFWPKLAHFHQLSIWNQNQSMSILVMFRENRKVIALLFGQKSLIFITCQSAIKLNQLQFDHLSLICGQHTTAIALLSGQNWLMLITCHSAIKINQF